MLNFNIHWCKWEISSKIHGIGLLLDKKKRKNNREKDKKAMLWRKTERRSMNKRLTANDTVFIMYRRMLNPRIFLVSRTCSRERRGALSGTLEVATSPSALNIRRLNIVKSTWCFHGLQQWSDPPDTHHCLKHRRCS